MDISIASSSTLAHNKVDLVNVSLKPAAPFADPQRKYCYT